MRTKSTRARDDAFGAIESLNVMKNNCLKFCSIALVFLLAHCSLVGEPTYRRFAPEIPLITEEDGAVVDVPDPLDQVEVDSGEDVVIDAAEVVDADRATDADVATDNPSVPIYPERCAPGAVEICNGIDDDCNNVIDELPANPAVTCLTSSGAMGTQGANCECVPTRMSSEICYNGVDDDGNGMTPDECNCRVLLSSDSAVVQGRQAVTSWSDALLAVMALPTAEKVICLVTPPVGGGVGCNPNWIFPDNITLPANVQLIGGFARGAGAPVRDLVGCRPTLSGIIAFAPNATLNTSLVGVKVRPMVSDRTISIDMQGAGSVTDVLVVREGSTATETIGVGSILANNASRWLRNISISLDGLTQHGAGVSFQGGQLFSERLRVAVRSSSVRAQVRGVRLTEMSFAQLKETSIDGLSGGVRTAGIELLDPAGPTRIARFTSLVPIVASANVGFAIGLSAACSRATQSVSVVDVNWAGGSAPAAGGATGLQSDRCDLAVSTSNAMRATPSMVVAAAGILAPVAQTAAALVCQGLGTCTLSNVNLLSVNPIGRPSAVSTASGIIASDQTRITLSDVRVLVGVYSDDRLGSRVANRTVGIELDRSSLFAERSILFAGTTANVGQVPVSVRWNGGPSLVLRESVIVVQDGIGVQIPANSIAVEGAGVALVSNTFLRPSSDVPFRSIAQLSITGMLRVGAQFRVVNNIFAPLVPGESVDATSSVTAIRSDLAQVFSEFTHNLVGSTTHSATIGAMAYLDAAQARTAFGFAGSFIGPMPVLFRANDYHILAASPARGTGYLPAVAGRRDIDGEPRARPALGADIGADEID